MKIVFIFWTKNKGDQYILTIPKKCQNMCYQRRILASTSLASWSSTVHTTYIKLVMLKTRFLLLRPSKSPGISNWMILPHKRLKKREVRGIVRTTTIYTGGIWCVSAISLGTQFSKKSLWSHLSMSQGFFPIFSWRRGKIKRSKSPSTRFFRYCLIILIF